MEEVRVPAEVLKLPQAIGLAAHVISGALIVSVWSGSPRSVNSSAKQVIGALASPQGRIIPMSVNHKLGGAVGIGVGDKVSSDSAGSGAAEL